MEGASKGKVLGGILLVAGCCIGAGMLGLPVLTAPGGFRPTLFMFAFSWSYMALTGLLLLEVNLWFKKDVNIVTMAEQTLGLYGKILGWGLFAFLFYSLMVAYVGASGQLFSEFFNEAFRIRPPEWVGSLGITLFFGCFLYLGTGVVDRFNRLLMGGLIASYFLLVALGSSHVKGEYLLHADFSAAVYALPAMIISFGYHNLVPSLATYFDRDVKKLKTVILAGSLLPLLIYLMWEWLILGIVPLEGVGGFRETLDQGDMATAALRKAVGSSWVVDLAEYFAFFAIVTSFLSVALSFVDFLADGLKIKKDRKGKLLLCALCLAPPSAFAFIYPKIFLTALNAAGAYGAVILFGVLPALMAWSGRYRKGMEGKRLVPGGKITLVLIILISLGVAVLETLH